MSVEEVIAEAVSGHDYPVCFGFPAGHFDNNCALVLGQKSSFKISAEKVTFKLL